MEKKRANLSVTDVAIFLDVSIMRAYQIVHSPGFPAYKVGRKIFIPADKFIEWVESRRINAPEPTTYQEDDK